MPPKYDIRNIPRVRNPRRHLEGFVEWEGYQGYTDEEDQDQLDDGDGEDLDEEDKEEHDGPVDGFVQCLDVGDVP